MESIAATIVAGILFGLAAFVPFSGLRFLPSRLLLAAVALVPLGHFWWVFLRGDAQSLSVGRLYWFDGSSLQFVWGALAGIAIASGFAAKDSSGPTSATS